MKKSILFLLTVFLFTPSLTFAQSAENVTKKRPDRSSEPVEILEINQTASLSVAEIHANRLERRFKFYYDRLNGIMMRFQTRLDLLSSEGKSTSATQIQLNAAKAKLEEAKLSGVAAVAAFRAIDPAKVKEQRTELKEAVMLAKKTRDIFQESLALLKTALKELKTISKPALPAASPAVQNSL